jgi:hypothetical protein
MTDNATFTSSPADNRARRITNGCRQHFQSLGRHLDDARIALDELRRAIAVADEHALMPGEVDKLIAELSGHLGAAKERMPRIDEVMPPAVSYDQAELIDWLAELASAARHAHERGLTIEHYEAQAAKRYPGISRSELLDAAEQARQRLRK